MNQVSKIKISAAPADNSVELRKLLFAPDKSAACPPTGYDQHEAVQPRVFQLDAGFESAGVWSGVNQLVEIAYRELLAADYDAIIDEHPALEFVWCCWIIGMSSIRSICV